MILVLKKKFSSKIFSQISKTRFWSCKTAYKTQKHPKFFKKQRKVHGCRHLFQVVGNSLQPELYIGSGKTFQSEELEHAVGFDVSEYSLRLYRPPASVHETFLRCEQIPDHILVGVKSVVYLYGPVSLCLVAFRSERTSMASPRSVY